MIITTRLYLISFTINIPSWFELYSQWTFNVMSFVGIKVVVKVSYLKVLQYYLWFPV